MTSEQISQKSYGACRDPHDERVQYSELSEEDGTRATLVDRDSWQTLDKLVYM